MGNPEVSIQAEPVLKIDTIAIIHSIEYTPCNIEFRAGVVIKVTLKGEAGAKEATFEISGLTDKILMTEDPAGTYTYEYRIPENVGGTYQIIGYLKDDAGNETNKSADQDITIVKVIYPPSGSQTVYDDGDAGKWSSLAIDSHGNPHIAFLVYKNDEYRLKYIKWNSDAGEWAEAIDIGEEVLDFPVSLAVGTDDIPRISYLASEKKLKLATLNVNRWDREEIESDVDQSKFNNSLFLSNENYPHICYGQLYYRFKNTEGWRPPIRVVNLLPGQVVYDCRLALDSQELPNLIYIHYLMSYIHIESCKPIIDNGEITGFEHDLRFRISTTNYQEYYRPAFAIDSDDKTHIVTKTRTGSVLRFYLNPEWDYDEICRDLENVQIDPSIIAQGNKITVSHRQPTYNPPGTIVGGYLRLTSKTPFTEWSDEENDKIDRQGYNGWEGDVGHFSSIAIDPLIGRIMVSYYSKSEFKSGQGTVDTKNLKIYVEEIE